MLLGVTIVLLGCCYGVARVLLGVARCYYSVARLLLWCC